VGENPKKIGFYLVMFVELPLPDFPFGFVLVRVRVRQMAGEKNKRTKTRELRSRPQQLSNLGRGLVDRTILYL
jgi:hypothetical protein